MNIDVWCWCLGDSDAVFMVSMHNAVLLLIPWVWWSRMNAVYAGERVPIPPASIPLFYLQTQ